MAHEDGFYRLHKTLRDARLFARESSRIAAGEGDEEDNCILNRTGAGKKNDGFIERAVLMGHYY